MRLTAPRSWADKLDDSVVKPEVIVVKVQAHLAERDRVLHEKTELLEAAARGDGGLDYKGGQ